jgi:glutamate-1-semialdehyde 2,1-aminomutase
MSDFAQLGSRRYGVARSWKQYREACQVLPWGTGTGSKRPAAALEGDQPAQIDRAYGSRVWDVDGNEYIDFRLGCGPITLGYGNRRVNRAAKAQIDWGVLTSLPVDLERRVAKLLIELVPCAEMAKFFKGGGEAMHAATRVARHVTHRDRVITCGYHGWGIAMDDTQPQALRALFTALPYGNAGAFADYLAAHGEETACVCISGDYAVMRPGDPFLADVRELTRRYGVLLVVDEIVTGFRVRRGGVHEYYDVMPDLAVFAKGIANGYPLAAVTGRREIMEQWPGISLTYGGEAVSLAAAEATLQIYRDEDVIGRLWQLGERLQSGVNEAAAALAVPFRLEGLPVCPMMRFTAEAEAGDATRPAAARRDPGAYQTELFRGLFRRGLIPYMVMYESLAHTEAEIDYAIEACRESLREAYGIEESKARGVEESRRPRPV